MPASSVRNRRMSSSSFETCGGVEERSLPPFVIYYGNTFVSDLLVQLRDPKEEKDNELRGPGRQSYTFVKDVLLQLCDLRKER